MEAAIRKIDLCLDVESRTRNPTRHSYTPGIFLGTRLDYNSSSPPSARLNYPAWTCSKDGSRGMALWEKKHSREKERERERERERESWGWREDRSRLCTEFSRYGRSRSDSSQMHFLALIRFAGFFHLPLSLSLLSSFDRAAFNFNTRKIGFFIYCR